MFQEILHPILAYIATIGLFATPIEISIFLAVCAAIIVTVWIPWLAIAALRVAFSILRAL